jgi:heme/copper-type cytochrome/quinol oxidase subunit 2
VIAYTATAWTQVVVALSIFVPVVITLVLTWVFLRGSRNDPDEQRLRRAQEEHRRRDTSRT